MILQRSNILTPGRIYTFTYSSGEIIEDSESWVKEQLDYFLGNYGSVASVNRNFGSGHFVIVVIPAKKYELADWMAAFEYAFQMMGWANNAFIQAEGGSVSSSPGGVSQAAKEALSTVAQGIGETASAGIGAMLKPLAPYLIIAAAALLYWDYRRKR